MQFPSHINWLQPVLVVLVFAVLIYLFLRWFERMNVWIPRYELVADPAQAGFQYEEIFLTTPDHIKIHCWYIPHENAKGCLLFCHGNMGNISHRMESIRQFHSLEMNVMIFDYRGYGISEGRLSEQGTYTDAETAYHWLKEREPGLPIVIFGRSMGAAIATEIAARVDANALIFESGFLSIKAMGKELFPWFPVWWFNTVQYESLSKIHKINMPLLVIHSPDDDLVPYSHGKQIFDAAHEPKQFINLKGTHNEGHFLYEDEYLQNITSFLEQHVFIQKTVQE